MNTENKKMADLTVEKKTNRAEKAKRQNLIVGVIITVMLLVIVGIASCQSDNHGGHSHSHSNLLENSFFPDFMQG
jgi:septal ring-binding cell division protein DamX